MVVITKMKLSVIVPVYNEQPQLESLVCALMRSPCPLEREWIFIDDASTDQSLNVLKTLQKQYGFKLLEQHTNQGKGSAVARGIGEASGAFIMVQDADFEYDPADVPELLDFLIRGEADVVYGSRFKETEFKTHRNLRAFANFFLTFVSNRFSGLALTDMETCYKIFRADLLKCMRLRSKRFGIEVELTAFVGKTRARISEHPISYSPRGYFQGKKITWKDGVAALWHLLYFNYFVSVEEAFENIPTKYLNESHGAE
jgi:glycosyltransferase involved in cell wall biosynthesis